MNRKSFLAGLGLVVAGSALFTSCIERGDYNSNPNNNNNYNHHYSDTNYVFDEEFNVADNYGWAFTDPTDSAYATVTGGSYEYVDYSTTKSSTTVMSTGINVAGNFTVTTRIKSNVIMGLIFGASSTSPGYAFYIDTAGNYSLYAEGSGTTASTPIITSTQDTLYAAKDNWNILEMDQTNGVWTFYINGTQVSSMAARAISGDGFGFKVLPGTTGYADYIVVKND